MHYPPKLPLFAKANAFFALAFCAGAGCSTGPEPAYEHFEHHLHRLALESVHARRPVAVSAEDNVYPDEEGYRRSPAPDRRLDCQRLDQLFGALEIDRVQECLASVKSTVTVRYLVKRDVQPKLILEAKDAPACLRQFAPELPMPREIVFQSNEEHDYSCFAASLDLSEGKVFGHENPLKHAYLEVEFPIPNPPTDARRTVNLLASWVLTPFLRGDENELVSKYVPTAVCQRCFGEMKLLNELDRPVYWPEP